MRREEAQCFARLSEWLEAAGGMAGRIRIARYDDGNRGVCAAERIGVGEEVLRVPRECLLTLEVVSPMRQRLEAAGARLEGDNSCVAAYLLSEMRNPGSWWQPFFATLPKSHDDAPVLFRAEELSLLKGSMALGDIEQRRRLIAADYESLCRHVPGFDGFTLELFTWAYCTVTSRIFGLKMGEETTHGMAPLADIFNHRNPPDLDWEYDQKVGSLVMKAKREIATGEAIHISYGNKCNSRFFVNMGFCDEENPENCAEMDLPDAARDHPLAWMAWTYGYPGMNACRRFRVPAKCDAWATQQMFSFLRLACARGEDVNRLKQLGPECREIGPVSRENEAAVWKAIGKACEARLGWFETTLEEDAELLRDGRASGNARNCIVMRSGEKRVLRGYVELARYMGRMLSEGGVVGDAFREIAGFEDYLGQLIGLPVL